jgi:hypothetical protein
MNAPKAVSTNQTTVKRMAIMMMLAFAGSQLSTLGAFATFMAALAVSRGTFLGIPNHPNIGEGIAMAVLAALLFLASFLALSLYPEHGRRQVAVGFLALVAWVIGFFFIARLLELAYIYERFTPTLEICSCIAIMICLLVSGRIKGWLGLAGLGLGLAIGIGLCTTKLKLSPDSLDFSPLWLSAVFYSELFSRRAGWRAALVGALLWAGLIALSALAASFLHIF